MSIIRFRNTYRKHRSLRGANVRCSDIIPCGLGTPSYQITCSWNWLVCQIEHYQRATALDGSGLHWLGTGSTVVVGFDASLILSCQAVLGSVKSSPQVLDLRVIELARTMSRGPRARNGQNHVSNRCVGSCNGWCCACISPYCVTEHLVAVQYRTVLTNIDIMCGVYFGESHHANVSTM